MAKLGYVNHPESDGDEEKGDGTEHGSDNEDTGQDSDWEDACEMLRDEAKTYTKLMKGMSRTLMGGMKKVKRKSRKNRNKEKGGSREEKLGRIEPIVPRFYGYYEWEGNAVSEELEKASRKELPDLGKEQKCGILLMENCHLFPFPCVLFFPGLRVYRVSNGIGKLYD
ncbi:uncharacterized protein BDZ99DRAFT_534027 [Mytilinidion resinicola]|uniref:Uncharacterized protein n=1 Tax=Mytilinidion resinicola TaxID=574789 RepID=A0A6A6YKC9_9PEZI|nr:uncharacterized protein BDZ99DRAFT_534027 [Mytilinidion resinicola]KAF2809250.1 hypothetical protein BDZ99DRAFT_534027 [Mytilinidion resinicola]